jgi:hypothetical protein
LQDKQTIIQTVITKRHLNSIYLFISSKIKEIYYLYNISVKKRHYVFTCIAMHDKMLNIICRLNTLQAICDSYSECGLIMFHRDINAEGRSLNSYRNIGFTFLWTNDVISLVYLPHLMVLTFLSSLLKMLDYIIMYKVIKNYCHIWKLITCLYLRLLISLSH